MGKTYEDEIGKRYRRWKEKICKEDTYELRMEKKDALRSAIELCYSDETLERILDAKTEIQIDNALKFGRGGGNGIEYRRTNTKHIKVA